MEELKNEMEEVKELKNEQCSIIESLLKDRRIDTPSKELTQSRSRNRLPSPPHAGVKEGDLGRPPGPESDYRVDRYFYSSCRIITTLYNNYFILGQKQQQQS